MSGTVRARMKRGMLELLEKVDIPEGTEVSVTILETPRPSPFNMIIFAQ
jgi:predicted DNA-binding antitoxin AbrB/MazE fold protein